MFDSTTFIVISLMVLVFIMLELYSNYRRCQPLFLRIFLVNCVQIDRIVSHHIAVLTLGGIKTNINFSVIVSLKSNHHAEDSVERHHFPFSVGYTCQYFIYRQSPENTSQKKKILGLILAGYIHIIRTGTSGWYNPPLVG